jgi:hypothetical protein
MRYTQQPYDPTANSGSIAELLMRSGQVQSEKLRDLAQIAATSQQQQGDAYSNLARNLGQIGTGAVGNFIDLRANEQKNKIAQQELAQRQQVNEAQIAASQAQTARSQFDLTQAQKTVADEASLKEKNRIANKIADGLRDPDPQKREVVLGIIKDPEMQSMTRNILLGRDKQNDDYRAIRAQFAAANGYDDDTVRIVVALDPMPGALEHFDRATNGGQDKAAVKRYVDAFWKKPQDDEYVMAAPGSTPVNKRTGEAGTQVPGLDAPTTDRRNISSTAPSTLLRSGSNGQMFTLDNQPLPASTKIQAKPEKVAGEGAHFWVKRGGDTIRISERDYRQGDIPVKEGEARPVTSGDAEDLANFDSALDDLAVVRQATTAAGTTGIRATLGAKTPAWVTSITGWGTEAKARQGLIDLVKADHRQDASRAASCAKRTRSNTRRSCRRSRTTPRWSRPNWPASRPRSTRRRGAGSMRLMTPATT